MTILMTYPFPNSETVRMQNQSSRTQRWNEFNKSKIVKQTLLIHGRVCDLQRYSETSHSQAFFQDIFAEM